jgi:thymidylate kinase
VTDASALAAAARALDDSKVAWAILRRTFDTHRPTGDVDILIEPAGMAGAVALLRAAGFITLPWTDGSSRGMLRYDPVDDSWLWLDLQEILAFGGKRVPAGTIQDMLGRRRPSGDLVLLDPGDEFGCILARTLLDGRSMEERHRARLVDLVAEVDAAVAVEAPFARWLNQVAEPPAKVERAWRLVASGAWSDLEALGGSRRPRTNADGAPRRARVAARAFVRAVTGQGGRAPSVALLGPDGAGKSTLAATLEERYPFATRRIYMGVGPPPGTPRKPFVLAAPASAGGLLLQWSRFLAGRYHQYRGRLVIFDRYMEDPWLPLPAGASLPRRIGRRVRAAISCPPADLMLVLDAPGSEMYARKGEHSATLLEVQRQRYLRLGERVPHAIVIDATAGTDAVARRAAALIWRRLQVTWGGASRNQL